MEFQTKCSLIRSPSMSEDWSIRSQAWSSRMPQGLDLEISHHPLTMKRVVNLVIAIDRLKAGAMGSTFRDEDLLEVMLESAMEEHPVREAVSLLMATPGGSGFSRTGEVQCSVADTLKRNWVFLEETMELHGVMLQGGSSDRRVKLNMSTYKFSAPTTQAQPVALGIRGTKLYLSCSMEDGRPTLHLEEVENKEDLQGFSHDSDLRRFLFHKRASGFGTSSFMSASNPGWYISTAPDDNLPVDMCQQASSRYQTFSIRYEK